MQDPWRRKGGQRESLVRGWSHGYWELLQAACIPEKGTSLIPPRRAEHRHLTCWKGQFPALTCGLLPMIPWPLLATFPSGAPKWLLGMDQKAGNVRRPPSCLVPGPPPAGSHRAQPSFGELTAFWASFSQFCSENGAPVSSKHREGAGRLHGLESVQVCRFEGPGL